ncbi:MAG: hypothetical protein LBI57_04115 [Helicobacteraceae bacterium]|jgi:hypothetical protein|nr:hypothetical protein [Helicobacteraceae bacterium]
MRSLLKAAFFAAIALSAPLVAWANHAIKVNPDQWQLVGITGYYAVSVPGAEGQSPNLAGEQVVIDLADTNDNISWDANTSVFDLNNAGAVGAGYHFATANDASGITYRNNPNPSLTGNDQLGFPLHSIVGLRTLQASGSLAKSAISFSRPKAPAATNGKDYGASLITLYAVSPYSNGAPDVMIVFAANLLNRDFKISFKNGLSDKWDFAGAGDKVYSGKFNYNATYDSPLRIGAGLYEIPPTSSSAGSQNNYRSFANTIDLNVSDNIAENFGELNNSNFQAFEGNFTAYEYDAAQGLWKVGVINDAKAGGYGTQTISGIGESGSVGSTNKVDGSVTGDFRRWTSGYGYWVRIWDDANVSSPGFKGGQPGILANSEISGAGDYSSVIKNGWNLLSFPDGVLRYTASGFKISAATNLQVVSPFGDHNATLTGVAASDCNNFNKLVAASNARTGAANALEVSCFNGGGAAYLISSKPFYIVGATVTNVQSLAGYQYLAADLIDINGTSGNPDALRTRLGEYALLAEINQDYNTSSVALPTAKSLGLGVPSWYNVDPEDANGSDFADINASFVNYLTSAALPTPSYDAVKRAQASLLDSNSTTAGPLVLLAANNRFYIRDNVAVRIFKLNEVNGSVLSIDFDGASHVDTAGNSVNPLVLANGAINCTTIATYVSNIQSDVKAPCYDADTNNTVAFYSDAWRNFDVKEINASRQLLVERYITSNEKNGSAYGAIKRVIQPSQLFGSFDAAADGFTLGGLPNLTYTSVWAEDFPNGGALYHISGNGFKPEMILTGVTSDGTFAANSAGSIGWKALDVTRDPADWFNSANDFELFWTEKERGYWVYVQSGYTNPVTVSGVNLNDTSVVTKHFNNRESVGLNELQVFNWLDGYVSASVGGLTRPNYTSGETYVVRARLDGDYLPLVATGGVVGSSATFSAYLNDFEVGSLRPTGPRDLNVTATDGLGGGATSGVQIVYVQPATPEVNISGSTLTATSNAYANAIALFAGHVSDENNGAGERRATAAATAGVGTIDLSSANIDYPTKVDINATRHVTPPYNVDTNPDPIIDLRVIAATRTATDPFSVYSNMRRVNFAPAYSNTFHAYANGEQNITVHTAAYGNALANYDANTSADIAFRGANAAQLTLIYQPINPNQGLANNAPQHVNINVGGLNAQIQYLAKYEGRIFYVYNNASGAWYYGIFPGNESSIVVWGQSGYDLSLATLPVSQVIP